MRAVWFALLLLLLLAILASITSAFADDCYSVGSGGTANITGPDGVCRRVYNGDGLELCVMTYSVAEWQNFYNNPPGGVSVGACPQADCGLPWGGSIASGQSVTAYASYSVGCGGSCSAETRYCNNGSLSGSYGASSCSVDACAPSAHWQYSQSCNPMSPPPLSMCQPNSDSISGTSCGGGGVACVVRDSGCNIYVCQ